MAIALPAFTFAAGVMIGHLWNVQSAICTSSESSPGVVVSQLNHITSSVDLLKASLANAAHAAPATNTQLAVREQAFAAMEGADQQSKAFGSVATQSWLAEQEWPIEFVRCNSNPAYIHVVSGKAGDYFNKFIEPLRKGETVHCGYADQYMPIMLNLPRQPKPGDPAGGEVSYVLDCGCNVGLFAFPIAALGHHVICFDPVPSNIQRLTAAVIANGFQDRVTLVHAAVSNKWGKTEFTVVPGQTDTSSLNPNAQILAPILAQHGAEKIQVDVVTIDKWLEQHPEVPPDKIQFMKVDVEGYEFQVFEGAKNLLEKHGSHIEIEAEFVPMYVASQGDSNPADAPRFMSKVGYHFGPCADKPESEREACTDQWITTNYNGIGQNINYIHKSKLPRL